MSPQILMGASNSKRLGCFVKISRAAIHKLRISASVSWTGFPGRPFRASKRRFIMSSTTLSSMAIVKPCPTPQLTCPLRGRRKKERKDRSLVFFAVGWAAFSHLGSGSGAFLSLSLAASQEAGERTVKVFLPHANALRCPSSQRHCGTHTKASFAFARARFYSPAPPKRADTGSLLAPSNPSNARTGSRHPSLRDTPAAAAKPPPRLYRYLPSRLAPRTGRKPSRRGHR
mmetsp:Transcript_4690/g.11889  ORF Transcript_4690/g.11889 Transcript_4690/m.11889 type:complete len:229 (-) Transcript_4690:14-700(-)